MEEVQSKLHMALGDIILKEEEKKVDSRRKATSSNSMAAKSSNNRDHRKSAPYSHSSRQQPRYNNGAQKDRVAIKFLLSNHMAGSLIGNGGSSINELMKITRADIHVSDLTEFYPDTSYRVAYITGTDKAVTLAQSLIWEMIGQQTYTFQQSITETWEPKYARDNPGKYDHVEVEGRIAVPAAAAGAILGRGGATIRAIGEQSEINVSLNDKGEGEFTQERIVSMYGRLSGCMNCTNLVIEKMAEEVDGYDYLCAGTTYPKFVHNKTASITRGDRDRDDGGFGRGRDRDGGSSRDYRNHDDRQQYNDVGRRVEYYHHHHRDSGNGNNGSSSRWDHDQSQYGSTRRRAYSDQSNDDRHHGASRGGSGGNTNYGRQVVAPTSGGGGGGASYSSVLKAERSGGALDLSDLGGAETLSANTEIRLAVPDHLIGAILGPQGAVLQEINNLSGAAVVIGKRGEFLDPVTKTRLVTVTGSPACAQTAHTLIVHKLKQFSAELMN